MSKTENHMKGIRRPRVASQTIEHDLGSSRTYARRGSYHSAWIPTNRKVLGAMQSVPDPIWQLIRSLDVGYS